MAVLLLALVWTPGTAQAQDDAKALVGAWVTPENEARIEIRQEKDGKFFGKIVWIKDTKYPADDAEAGKEKHDRHNPDAAKHNDPIVGLEVLKGFSYSGKNLWEGGTIYDPKNGNTYKCKITLKGKELQVRGFIGISLIGRTEVWTHYEEPKAEAPKK
jgi:uncharacterized protein (DUF2147 family)